MQGTTVNGYTLQRLLGAGGMAEVWLAENRIGKKAAVKVLLPKLCDDTNVTSRFMTEAKVMVELDHRNIRQVYDYSDIDGRPCIIMEYLEGDDLKTRMKRGQRFTEQELEKWWNQLVDALNYTHSKGIVHRDIKPGNIFVDTDDNIKLLDFGIAKVRESISSTQTGQKLGTLMYMSPEQVKDSKNIDYHIDLYSSAVTFVHLITGKAPYDSDTTSDFEISEQIVYKPLDLNKVPTFWCKILLPYLSKEAEDRPALKPIEESSLHKNNNSTNDDSDHTILAPKESPEPTSTNKETTPTPDEDATTYLKKTQDEKPKIAQETITKKPRDERSTKTQDGKPNKTHSTKPKGTKVTIIIIAVLVAILVAVVASSMIEKKKQEAARIARFTEIYESKTKSCDLFVNSVVIDRDGNQANKHFIIESLMTLKEIERLESSPNFEKMGIAPQYQKLFNVYISNLRKAETVVDEKYKHLIELGLTDNKYCDELKERLDLIRDILRQSQNGSAATIELKQMKK